MRRRSFVLSSLAGAGLAAVGTGASKVLAQQSGGRRPLAILAADTAHGPAFVRAYRAPGRGQYIVMARVNGRDVWHRVSLGDGANGLLRAASRNGGLRGQMGPTASNPGSFEIQQMTAGQLRLRVTTPDDDVVEGPAAGDEPTGGGTQSLGFWGALVAIIALLVARDIVAMATGNETGSWRLRARGAGSEVEVEVTSADDLGEGDGFMHDPICDTVPPMLC